MDLYYRFGIAGEKKLFKDNLNLYDGIVISAHVAVYYKKFFRAILPKLNKKYFIDPFTYVFTRNPKIIRHKNRKGDLELKKSFSQLIPNYGKKLEDTVKQIKRLDKNLLQDSSYVTELTSNVLNFQENVFKSENFIKKYKKILDEENVQVPVPEFLVPPYFYIENDENYKINLAFAKKAKELAEDKSIVPIVLINKDMLGPIFYETFLADYKEFDKVFIWVNDFNELRVSDSDLKKLKEFIKHISRNIKPCLLYSDYFALLLSKVGLAGYCTGICYGNQRVVDTELTGGGFNPRLYLKLIKNKIPAAEIHNFLHSNPKELKSCLECSPLEGLDNVTAEEFIETIFSSKKKC